MVAVSRLGVFLFTGRGGCSLDDAEKGEQQLGPCIAPIGDLDDSLRSRALYFSKCDSEPWKY
jgi:hypothetical protein